MGRRPRMKVYDYNQEFGGNYYQPMIQYINHKDTYGPFHTKADVYLPHTAEVRSNKYTNMRYQDKSSAKHNLDEGEPHEKDSIQQAPATLSSRQCKYSL